VRASPLICYAALFFLLHVGAAAAAVVQNYAVDWHVIAAGGGISSNASYTIAGTAGQPGDSHSGAGRYAVDAGFWASAAVVQTPGAPLLALRRTSAATLTVSWPSPSDGFVLQSTTDLSIGNWTTVTNSPADDQTTRSVIIPLSPGNQFFRLIKASPSP
jgi:hypothetical protein